MMPWSGLSLTSVKHAYEMGTSELHRTSIMLAAVALTTNRSMYPKDLSQRLCEKAGRTRRPKSTAVADHSACAKSLDRSGPVTEVLSLDKTVNRAFVSPASRGKRLSYEKREMAAAAPFPEFFTRPKCSRH